MPDIDGTVEDSSGTVIDGARVFLLDQDAEVVDATQTTNASGEFSFATSWGTDYHVLAHYRDGAGDTYGGDSQPHLSGNSSDITITLDSSYAAPFEDSVDIQLSGMNIDVSGVLQESDAGTPVAVDGATVELRTAPTASEGSDTTDASGNWTVTDVREGEWVFAVVDVGGETRTTESLGAADASSTYTLDVPVYDPAASSLSPQGNIYSSGVDISLSVDVTDPDFPSDDVTVEFFDDGDTSIGTDTVTADGGTASVTHTTESSAGVYEWYAELDDQYNSTGTVTTASGWYGVSQGALDDTAGAVGYIYASVQYVPRVDSGVGDGSASLTIENTATNTVLHSDDSSTAYKPNESRLYQVVDTSSSNLNANAIDITLTASTTDSDAQWVVDSGAMLLASHKHAIVDAVAGENAGVHAHPVKPGIVESFDGATHYPKNCDILIDGTPLDVSLGDGTGSFEEVVDIRGELAPGQDYTIEVTSETEGHIQAFLEGDVYRQILGDG